MDEKQFYRETKERKPFQLCCPHCSHRFEHEILWYRRIKKGAPPSGAATEDMMRFRNARSYMIRAEDVVMCPNDRCRKKVEIVGLQSIVYLEESPTLDQGRGGPPDSGGRGGREEPGSNQPELTSHFLAKRSEERSRRSRNRRRGGPRHRR